MRTCCTRWGWTSGGAKTKARGGRTTIRRCPLWHLFAQIDKFVGCKSKQHNSQNKRNATNKHMCPRAARLSALWQTRTCCTRWGWTSGGAKTAAPVARTTCRRCPRSRWRGVRRVRRRGGGIKTIIRHLAPHPNLPPTPHWVPPTQTEPPPPRGAYNPPAPPPPHCSAPCRSPPQWRALTLAQV